MTKQQGLGTTGFDQTTELPTTTASISGRNMTIGLGTTGFDQTTELPTTTASISGRNMTIGFGTTGFDQTNELPTTTASISGRNMTIGSRGRSFIVLFMTDYGTSTKNIYITSENGVQMNMSTSEHLGTSLKSQIDRVVKIPSNEHIIVPPEITLKSFQKERKAILLETSDDVFVITHADGINTSDLQKLEVFQNICLRRIQGIFWPEKIRNEDLLKRCNCHSIAEELKKDRFRWLGHVRRMTNERLPKVALRWTPPGKRKPDRPRTTWRRTVLAELQDLGYSLSQAQHLAKDRVK
uniref:Uncharacterized protein LOC111113483 n=1 Tax=Crassostrea virginica TaxID=6565 RepID=A0A8B8BX94_CRAVI|nr:uncharacterized protein LOC111113483 [Crassostrea virginica]